MARVSFAAMPIRKIGMLATIVLGLAVIVAGFVCRARARSLVAYLLVAALPGLGHQIMFLFMRPPRKAMPEVTEAPISYPAPVRLQDAA